MASDDLPFPELVADATSAEVTNRGGLTDAEVLVLKNRFWTPRTNDENSKLSEGFINTNDEAHDEFLAVRTPAFLPKEKEAFKIGGRKAYARDRAVRERALHDATKAALPNAPEWIKQLYEEGKPHWGFICLYDAAAQNLDKERLEYFQSVLCGFFAQALRFNGSKDVISGKWRYMKFNAPQSALAPTAFSLQNDDRDDGNIDQGGGSQFRKAFQEILEDPDTYQKREDVNPINEYIDNLRHGTAALGFLTNTFLVFDPVCIDLVVESGYFYDNMRVLAFEAEFPVPGKTYAKGYQGYTWVRLDQLVYYFYELRLTKEHEIEMDKIWEVAQKNRDGVFVSMDLEEATNWSHSCHLSGFAPDSILGHGCFNYLNDPTIQALLGQIHRDIHSNLTEFDNIYNSLAPAQPVHTADLWTEFINFWAERVTNHFFNFLTRCVDGRIAQLRAGWQAVLDNDPSERQEAVALESLDKINALNDEIEATVVFNRAPFNP